MSRKPKNTKATIAVPIYRAIVLELERRRLADGISMEKMSELMGTAERSYAKLVHSDDPSGRVATWGTLQMAVDVLFCDGVDLRIERAKPGSPKAGNAVTTTAGTKRKIKNEVAYWNRPLRRQELMRLGALGGEARGKLPKERLSEIGRLGGLARHRAWEARQLAKVSQHLSGAAE